MSQRSAPSAAASATADVSDPPRPSVVTRLSGPSPWKPAPPATWPSFRRVLISPVSIFWIRALPCTPPVAIGICQPIQERAFTPLSCSAMASRPAVPCSPVATTVSYSRASCSGDNSFTQATSWLVTPAIAETTTATSWPDSTSRLTSRATFLIRPMSATEVPPNFMTRRAMAIYLVFQSIAGLPRDAVLAPAAAAHTYFDSCERSKTHHSIRGEARIGPGGRLTRTGLRRRQRAERRSRRDRALLRHGGRVVGPRRQVPPAAQPEPGAAGLHPRPVGRPLRPRS